MPFGQLIVVDFDDPVHSLVEEDRGMSLSIAAEINGGLGREEARPEPAVPAMNF